ncbi:MAG: N-acetyltransferase [bacterium]
MNTDTILRKASIKDVQQIKNLVNRFATTGKMLPLSLHEIYDYLRNFWIYEEKKEIVATCALFICWDDLAEIRSLAVLKKFWQRGIGTKLVNVALSEAKALSINKVFVLTYKTDFFEKLGFNKIDKSDLPHKVWASCLKCSKFPGCDEIAMIRSI